MPTSSPARFLLVSSPESSGNSSSASSRVSITWGGNERLSRWEIGETLLPWCPELKGHLMKGSARNHVGSPRPADYRSATTRSRTSCRFAFRGFVNGSPDVRAEVRTCGITSTEVREA